MAKVENIVSRVVKNVPKTIKFGSFSSKEDFNNMEMNGNTIISISSIVRICIAYTMLANRLVSQKKER